MTKTCSKYYFIQKLAWRTSLVLLFIFILSFDLSAQQTEIEEDTTTYSEAYKLDSSYHNPQKAALMSAILPGLGQVYNKKYWKVPIVFAGFGTLGFFINYNQKGYLKWRLAYIDISEDGILDNDLGYNFPLTKDQVERTKNSYKRYRDLSIIGTAGFYILQIIDATVDAYLFDWDISENLSMKLEPALIQSPEFFMSPASNTLALKASFSF